MAMSLASDAEIKIVAEFVSKMPVQKPAATMTDGDAQKGQALFTPCVCN